MRLGILGGGQLGRMLALAAAPLGVEAIVVDPAADACAGAVAELIVAAVDDAPTLARLAERCDAVTVEWENVPAGALEWLAGRVPTWPPAAALATAQDRAREKALFERVGVSTAPWRAVGGLAELQVALVEIGTPAILKARHGGYDGKGQARIDAPEAAAAAWDALAGAPAIVERVVSFERELSLIGVRGTDGVVARYPLTENEHRGGILRVSRAPARGVSPATDVAATAIADRLLTALDYVGVLAVELFALADGRLVANEIAPRVHNSGHWTIEGAVTSQFENHVRAVLGLPLGRTTTVAAATMVNLIGTVPPLEELLAIGGAHVHLYGKVPRPGRKLGHVTVLDDDAAGRRLLGVVEGSRPC